MKTRELYHYHIVNEFSKEWTPGTTIEISSNRVNKFHRDLKSLEGHDQLTGDINTLVGKMNDFQTLGNKVLEVVPQLNDTSEEIKQYRSFIEDFDPITNTCSRTLRYYVEYLRELIFEDVRKSVNKNLPSRISCLWACKEEDIETWKNLWTINKDFKLLKLSLTGEFHEADSRLINSNAWDIKTFEKNARAYWEKTPTGYGGEPQIEVLFEGNVTVLEEIKP